MKRCILFSAWCMLFAVLFPAAVQRVSLPEAVSASPVNAQTPSPAPETVIRLLRDGEITPLPLEEYLVGVVAGEMPAAFEPAALRAQAVAARTYALYRMASGSAAHPQADVCGDPGCCQAWLPEEELARRWGGDCAVYHERIRSAVADTEGIVLTWEGEPILACFHASSPGRTESSRALWGRELPYLVSVDSPETPDTLPSLISTVTLTADELRSAVSAVRPEADFSAPPEAWVGERVLDVSRRVTSLRIGGEAIPGTEIRALFGLRSACFSLEWTGDGFAFTVQGSGHGAGMSQYGAQLLAREGYTWEQILSHYYPGTSLSSAAVSGQAADSFFSSGT